MDTNGQLEELTAALTSGLRDGLGGEGRTMMRKLILLLAEGQALSLERIAGALGRSPDEVAATLRQLPGIEFDEQDNVVGAGLTLRPTPHHFIMNDRTMFTWCALDALMFQGLLGQTVEVQSPCAATGTPVRINVTPDGVEQITPPEAVVSIVHQDVSADIRGSFCCHVNFFSSNDVASAWLGEHPGATTLSVREAYRLGQRLAESVFETKDDGA